MDFSCVPRALESLRRRQPALPDDALAAVRDLEQALTTDGAACVDALRRLVTVSYETTSGNDATTTMDRWEPLAVGLYVGTHVLEESSTAPVSSATAPSEVPSATTSASTVYMDGPRVPHMTPSAATPSTTASPLLVDVASLTDLLYTTSVKHLEHAEPRVRTLVAKAVGACAASSDTSSSTSSSLVPELYQLLVDKIHQHIVTGRDEAGAITTTGATTMTGTITTTTTDEAKPTTTPQYSASSTGALDDTTGWRALETHWLCLASLSASAAPSSLPTLSKEVLQDCEHSCVVHVNRHVRAAALQCLEQWIRSTSDSSYNTNDTTTAALAKCVTQVLKHGLADNWSQVRMAASVLCRVWFTTTSATTSTDKIHDRAVVTVLLPRMCLNRFYLAQGVKLYSHDTWKLLFADGSGIRAVAEHLPAVCRYYVKMCDADNHVVREAACQAIAELAVRLGDEPEFRDRLEGHMPVLLQSLLMCFHDESWPVRDEACLACGIICKAYPEACRPEFKMLWERWTEQLTDQIWSVREDAAVALGDAMDAYGTEVLDKILVLVTKLLPAAREQPSMTAAEYKAHINDIKQHENAQLYSCGSLAPKLRKGGAGRIGCGNCGVDRPKAPWEATDGCIYLIRELIGRGTAPDTATPVSDATLVPIVRDLVDVCRVQHFYQADELRTTLWRNLPAMAQYLGKQRFKRTYLDMVTDLLFVTLDSRSASLLCQHAAGQCAEELSHLVGPAIFRARLEDDQRDCLDRVLRERDAMPKGPGHGTAFSPFGPPGLLDAVVPRS